MTDMLTPEQLTIASANATKVGLQEGTTKTTGLGSVMGNTWSDRIIFDAEPLRVLSKYFIEFNDLMGNNDTTLIIPKIGNKNLMGGRAGNIEAQARTYVEFDTASKVQVTLTATDVRLGGALITYETAQATRVSIMEMCHRELVREYLNTIEYEANATLEGAASPAGTVYGGDATSTATLSLGDVITVDKIVDMKITLQEVDFGKLGDAVLFIHPTTYKQLLKSSQFTNAAEFGGDKVVRQGVVEDYIGCKIEVSTLVGGARTVAPAGGDSFTATVQTGWGSGNGHYAYMIDPSAAAGIVWKEKAKVKVVSEDDERVHKVLLDAWFRMTTIDENAICLGCFSDS